MNAQEMQPADHGQGCPLRGVAGVFYFRRPECTCSIVDGEPIDLEPEVVHPRRMTITIPLDLPLKGTIPKGTPVMLRHEARADHEFMIHSPFRRGVFSLRTKGIN